MQGHTKRRIAFGMTTGGLLAGGGLGFAHADAGTSGSSANGGASNSPGILSGNVIQIPVDIPINVCGVTANVLGLLNPAAGNDCANGGGASASGGAPASGGTGGASAQGGAHGSPGVLSGNNVQIPVNVPVNVCGDSVSVVGVKDSAKGNHCANGGGSGAGAGSGGGASAQGGAHGSPGVLSGNNVQIPVNVPVNVCGDTVSVVGVKNSAVGNHCANTGGGTSGGGATATGGTHGSPGIGSGNNVQIPIDVPVNVCGDSVSVIGVQDSAKHNACDNGGGSTTSTTPPTTPPTTTPGTPPTSVYPPPPVHSTTPPTTTPTTPGTPSSTTPGGGTGTTGNGGNGGNGGTNGGSVGSETPGGTLAHTGADGLMLAPVGAGMAGAGLVLYRKFKPSGTH